ncbi:MAG: CNNM domain-containing protein [Phycisphaerae bacterium]
MIAMAATAQWAIWTAVAAGGAVLSFIYSALETGIYVMNKIRLDLHAETGSKAARAVRAAVANQASFLSALLIGANLANYAATFSVSAMFVLAGYGHLAEWYAMLVAAPALFVVCESVPKNLAQRAAERLVYRLADVLTVSIAVFNMLGLGPLVRGFSRLMMRLAGPRRRGYVPMGHEGLSAIVAEGQASGLLTHLQTVMADRVMHIAGVRLRDVMIPMARVAAAPARLDRDKMLDLMRAHPYSRFPLLDADGKVIEIVNIYDALAGADEVRPVPKAELLVLADATAVTDALFRMQRTHSPMAVVADEAGRHVGIVTIKDLVEEIVGELAEW